MRASIIIPVYNNTRDLPECLSAVKAAAKNVDTEIIVVDDGSTDDTPAVAASMGVRVLRLEKNSGPGAARNFGAHHALGDILFFVDADVVLAPDALDRVVSVLDSRPELAAVFGSYDARPRAHGLVSQYRNLLHHFVHQQGNPVASPHSQFAGDPERLEPQAWPACERRSGSPGRRHPASGFVAGWSARFSL